jgi:hypothetical protein
MLRRKEKAAGEGFGSPLAELGSALIDPNEAPSAATLSNDLLGERLAALAGLDLDDLRAEWRRLYRAAPPVRLSRDLLLRSAAHRLQEKAFGGLQPAAKRRLAGLARALATNGEAPPARTTVRLKPGTTLVREWHGRTHTVTVLARGFEHGGQHYASLTKLARTITGAHWSGPRFFGLLRGAKRVTTAATREAANAD